MNLFEQAIQRNELLSFGLGTGAYFLVDREHNDHSVLFSWLNHIVPLVKEKGEGYVKIFVEKMLLEVLSAKDIEMEEKNLNLIYHLHVYYYLASENRIRFDNFSNLNAALQSSLDEYLSFLKASNDHKVHAIAHALELIKTRGGLLPAEENT